LNERMRLLRKALGLNQTEFGARIGLTVSAISGMEVGERTILDRTIIAIVKEFGVSRYWFETGYGEMFDKSDARITVALEDILLGENDIGKAIIKTIATFTDDEWTLLKKMVDRLVKEYNGQLSE